MSQQDYAVFSLIVARRLNKDSAGAASRIYEDEYAHIRATCDRDAWPLASLYCVNDDGHCLMPSTCLNAAALQRIRNNGLCSWRIPVSTDDLNDKGRERLI